MLAVVSQPHTEISLNGEGAQEIARYLARKFSLRVICNDGGEDSTPIENTDFWREMQINRTGNLLVAARLKAGLTQKELAQRAEIRQSMISDFENGRRKITRRMAQRLSAILKIKPERLAPE